LLNIDAAPFAIFLSTLFCQCQIDLLMMSIPDPEVYLLNQWLTPLRKSLRATLTIFAGEG
jgi:hypothetical protein